MGTSHFVAMRSSQSSTMAIRDVEFEVVSNSTEEQEGTIEV